MRHGFFLPGGLCVEIDGSAPARESIALTSISMRQHPPYFRGRGWHRGQ
ncbi:hypothetical protein MT2993 [Mycobacterium tuberculosis CDC1551]|uniref:Uncharacterized protein n=1 Tax=Mycobacterium tuberculosis (strain CDC 1551 / Oshkosh) TaxID=83331 RepID=Q8VJA8_MYCTO|nr:hypothetical protein MT2993 [Mycobacterium tuberculosis CDC1551]